MTVGLPRSGGEARPHPAAPGPAVSQAGERRSARIESLRAVAALSVLISHSYALAGLATFATFGGRVMYGVAFLGVDVFFALTGYLIFLPLARRDYGGGRRVDLGAYALNRGLRILPLYYAVLVIVAAIDGAALGTVAWFAVFGENFKSSLVATAINGPMWSLVVELHFYILLPLIAWGLARISGGSALRAAALLLALAAVSVAIAEAELSPSNVWTYSFPVNFVFFVPGMLLALVRASRERDLPRWLEHPLARGDLWLAGAIAIWLPLFAFPQVEFRILPAAALGSLLVVAAAVLPVRRDWFTRLLDLRPLAIVGVASYSLYLWHIPILKWLPQPAGGYGGWLAFLALALPTCLAVALASYSVIEAPPLRLRRRWFAGSTAPVPTGTDGVAPREAAAEARGAG